MRGRLLALLMTLCAPLGAWAGAGGAPAPTGAGAARLHLPLGEECLPGSWVAATVVVPPQAGVLAPALAVWEEGAAAPGFTHELPPREFATAQTLRFRLVAPRRPAKLRLTLRDARGREVAREEVGALIPSASPTRLHPTLRSPLPAEEFYRPCTSVFIPAGAFPAAPSLADCQPLLDWIAAGGQALCADPGVYQALGRLQAARAADGAPAPGRPQRFSLGPGAPAVPFRLCGRGILADVGGQEAALPQLQEKLRRGYAPWAERHSPDWRLAPARYRALGAWPPPARVAPRAAALWLGGWLCLAVAAGLCLPPRARLAGVGGLTLAGAAAFLASVPIPAATAVDARFYDLTAPATCRGEFLTVATPAADGEEMTVPLPVPALLLAPDAGEIAAARLVLREGAAGAPGTAEHPFAMVVNRELVRRGAPLLFSLARDFPAAQAPGAAGETPLGDDAARALCGPLAALFAQENPAPPYTRNALRVFPLAGAGRGAFAARLERAPAPAPGAGAPAGTDR